MHQVEGISLMCCCGNDVYRGLVFMSSSASSASFERVSNQEQNSELHMRDYKMKVL